MLTLEDHTTNRTSPATLGELLYERRLRADMTQREAAEMFGVSQPSYGAWEANTSRPKSDRIPLVAEWLGISTDEALAMIHGLTEGQPRDNVLRIAELERRVEDLGSTIDQLVGVVNYLRAEAALSHAVGRGVHSEAQ